MTSDEATLAKIAVGLEHLSRSVDELKSDVQAIDTRLRSVELSVASRIKAPFVFAGASSLVAVAGFLFFVLDRMYGGA